jgi:hypothetical protein
VIEMMLSTRTAFFHTAGYLRVPGLMDISQVERLRDAAFGIAADGEHPHVRTTSDRTRIDQVLSFDPAFLEAALSDRMLDTLAPFHERRRPNSSYSPTTGLTVGGEKCGGLAASLGAGNRVQ